MGKLDASAYDPLWTGIRTAYKRANLFTPLNLATFGDSRCNMSFGALATSDGGYQAEKAPCQLMQLRGDMKFVFNGGVSGDTAANWNSASRISGNQAVTDCIAAQPDIVWIQYGINDVLASTAAATIVGNLQALINELVGAGIFVVFESIYTCAQGPASYINGYAGAGGFTNPAAQLAILQAVNSSMQAWLAGFSSSGKVRALYVETNQYLADVSGYAKTDGTWYDGTHQSAFGGRKAASIVNAAITPYFGTGYDGTILSGPSRNALNDGVITVSSGRASGYSAGATETGSLAYAYQVVQDDTGEWCQEYTITNSTAAGTAARARLEIVPSFIGSSTYPVLTAGDYVQAAIDVYADDGALSAPPVYNIGVRARIYYNDASNEYVQSGLATQLSSTDHPQLADVVRDRYVLPKRAIKAAMANANIITNTSLQVFVMMNKPGTTRVRVKRAKWRKVA